MTIGSELARDWPRDRQPAPLPSEIDALAQASEASYGPIKADLDQRKQVQFGITATELAPWHYDDPFLKEAPADLRLNCDRFFVQADIEGLARRTLAERGFDIEPLLATSDLYERPNKLQEAWWDGQTVLASIRPDQRWMRKILWVFAVAVGQPVLGTLLTRLPDDPNWLIDSVGVLADTVDPLRDQLAARRRERLLLRVRWGLVLTHFEQALYGGAENLVDVWWDLRERYQQISRPPGRKDSDWAAVPELVLAPGQAHHALLDELSASALAGEDLLDELRL